MNHFINQCVPTNQVDQWCQEALIHEQNQSTDVRRFVYMLFVTIFYLKKS